RTAVAIADHGLEEGLARSAPVIRAAHAQPYRFEGRSTVKGLPARPGAYVRDLDRRLADDKPRDAKFAAYVRPRLARARAFAVVTMKRLGRVVDESRGARDEVLRPGGEGDLGSGRGGAGSPPARLRAEWHGTPPWTVPLVGNDEPLSRRLAASPGASA